MKSVLQVSLLVAGALLVAACEDPPELAWGDARHGAAVLLRSTCGGCHVIPGIHGARGIVGPPLESFSERAYIARDLPDIPGTFSRRPCESGGDEPRASARAQMSGRSLPCLQHVTM